MMSSEKRRRARVQGGWASSAPKPRSNDDKKKTPGCPNWYGKTVDSPQKKFGYEEPTEDVAAAKIQERVIDQAGIYDISLEPSGVSRIRYFPNFIDPGECKEMYENLFSELPWRQKSDTRNGESYLQPRFTAWFGDHPYSYSGLQHEANTNWTPTLRIIQDRIEENTGLNFNSMLANLYRDGKDHLPWHSDDEASLGTLPTVASLSFGDTRNFEMRKRPPLELRATVAKDDYNYTEYVKVPLAAGTLLIMEGATQEDWHHRIPKEYHDREARINLTFRVIHAAS